MADNVSGGYRYQFVDSPPSYIMLCSLCKLPSRNPQLSLCCGELFCKPCLSSHNTKSCPHGCDEEFVTVPNKHIDRAIKNLAIFCTNSKKGCKWQGKLSSIDSHINGDSDDTGSCQFEDMTCPLSCGKTFQRRYASSHVETECPRREAECEYCHIKGEHDDIVDGEHFKLCRDTLSPCPNNCKIGSVPRKDKSEHMKVCPLEIIICEHHNVGCKHTFPRQNQEQHNKEMMEEHLLLTCETLGNAEDEYQAKIASVKKNAEERCKKLQMQLSNVTRQLEMLCSIWSIKINSMAVMSCSDQVAPVTFKISDFANKKSSKQRWRSPQFYSHNGGYTMVLTVNPAGDSLVLSSHISAYLHVVKGANDDKLVWPLKGRFIVKLLNQIEDKEHHPITFTYDVKTSSDKAKRVIQPGILSTGLGQTEFISHVNFHKSTTSCQYYKDDCVYFEVRKY
ncbi:TNF receptor-associated factor 4-like [Dysidea avara]|uniref:TNF receptor-associated factor 4-like n=1 Tax=Dysidea avara TaxID=196820 RepID=UPI00332210E5